MFDIRFTIGPPKKVIKLLKQMARDVSAIRKTLTPWPPVSGTITHAYLGEDEMANHRFKITSLPQVSDAEAIENRDIVGGELIVSHDGVDQEPIATAVGQTEIAEIVVPEGVPIATRFRFKDDATPPNYSPEVTGPTFTAADTTAPLAPVGDIGVEYIGEQA